MRGTQRLVAALLIVVTALLLQVTVFPHFAWNGVVPDLVLLAVVGAALVTDPRFATLLGFGAGLLLDLAPPADHAAGRWALALLVVGYVVSRFAHDHSPAQAGGGRPPYPLMLAAGAGGAFVGTSVFALTGTLLQDPAVGIGDMLEVVLTAVAYDVLVAVVRAAVDGLDPHPGAGTPRRPGHPAGTSADACLMSASTSSSSHRSRLRLIVIQVLAFSLLATLGSRLYYLQVVTGEEYQGKAASQSVRDIVVQPQRGLIVDAMGRPLVTNRLTWVASIDRTLIGRMEPRVRRALLKRVARVVGMEPREIARQLVLCGTEGAKEGVCWNGSPYQPVPVAQDLDDATALRINEQPEDFPGVVVVQQSVRDYPEPFSINAAHLLGYLSPITDDELTAAELGGDTSVNGASVVGRAGVEKEYDAWLRGQPGYERVKVNANGEVIGEEADVQAQPGDTLVTSIDAKVQGIVERELHQTIMTARATVDPVTGRHFEADSGAAVLMEVEHRPDHRDGQPADVRPRGLGRRDHPEAAQAALLRGSGHAAARPRDAGSVRPGLDLEAVHDRRRR